MRRKIWRELTDSILVHVVLWLAKACCGLPYSRRLVTRYGEAPRCVNGGGRIS